MYLARQIDDILESKKDKLVGRNSYYYIIQVLNRSFHKIEPFTFRYETFKDFNQGDYSVSGYFDSEHGTKYIILNFSNNHKTFTICSQRWKEFKFTLSQVCQHESIHQHQWQHRDSSMYEVLPPEFRNAEEKTDINEERDYLSDFDEIDAYAHDIIMEIKHYYPKKCPYRVLKSMNHHKKIWSYNYYKKTFKGTEWNVIKNRLYKKAYKWIPYVTV